MEKKTGSKSQTCADVDARSTQLAHRFLEPTADSPPDVSDPRRAGVKTPAKLLGFPSPHLVPSELMGFYSSL